MNFRTDYYIFIILSIILRITSIAGDSETFEDCPNFPRNLETVCATIYFNGCTDLDCNLFGNICSLRDGFPDDVLSITLKVGANVTVEGEDYSCWSEGEAFDCTCTFQLACLSQLMDQATLLDLMCCTEDTDGSLEGCITDFGMDQQLTACMNGETNIDPRQIAVSNSEEVASKGIILEETGEPFTLFTENYDLCNDLQAYFWWAQSICAQLSEAISSQLDNCQQTSNN